MIVGSTMFGHQKPKIVVSEPDIQAVLSHLRSLPYRENPPLPWDRQYVISLIREAIPSSAKIGDCIDVGPGVYGIIKPFAVDLVGISRSENRLQVWIAVRKAGTDPNNVTEL